MTLGETGQGLGAMDHAAVGDGQVRRQSQGIEGPGRVQIQTAGAQFPGRG